MRDVFARRRVVVAGAVAAVWPQHVELLRQLGVEDVLVVATEGRGAGPIADAPTVIVEPPDGLTMMERVRHGTAVLRDPPDEILDAVERFDPHGDAIVVGSFLNEAPLLAGRPFLAHRRPEWVALEDKVVVDSFWDRAGVERQPVHIAALDAAADTARSLDRGAGTVWAADAREGFHGGGTGTRWVTDAAGAARARQLFADLCDRVRIMPFVEGVPCSIHGIVLPDGVAVLRPVEMVVLRRGNEFVFAGCATFWDPPEAIREQMREVARRVGGQLVRDVDFRGCFTVDGIVADDGFWPTELNPRFGGGVMTIARASGIPLVVLNDLIVGGHGIGRDAASVESYLLAAADERRGGGTWVGGLDRGIDTVERNVCMVDGAWTWAPPKRTGDGEVVAGEGFVRCIFEPASVAVGPPTAGLAAAFWQFADAELGTDIGSLTAAHDPFG